LVEKLQILIFAVDGQDVTALIGNLVPD